jgi:hypothetical protein
MKVRLHPRAKNRLQERGATEEGVIATIEHGERFAAKHGRAGLRCNFPFDGEWDKKTILNKTDRGICRRRRRLVGDHGNREILLVSRGGYETKLRSEI